MKNLFILPILLGTILLAGCSQTETTPISKAPSSNSGAKGTLPPASDGHSNSKVTEHAKPTSTGSDEHHVSSEESFIEGMIPHHQEAIDAAKIIVAKSENKELTVVAQAIIDAQNKEMTQLKGWLKTWYPSNAMKSEYAPMMRDLSKLSGDELDDAFMEDMIKHHESAIHMAEDVLEISQRSEIVKIAKNIISTQQSEIAAFKKMHTDH